MFSTAVDSVQYSWKSVGELEVRGGAGSPKG